jgi:predicted nucleic acid-binding protein
VSLYVDTSCFLKLLFTEPETARVVELIAAESRLLVSTLTRIEALVQIRGREVGGTITRREGERVRQKMENLLADPPFESAEISGNVFQVAEREARASRKTGHCRTLDRLHLAAMENIGARRLLTGDAQQAEAARALGFDVILPR